MAGYLVSQAAANRWNKAARAVSAPLGQPPPRNVGGSDSVIIVPTIRKVAKLTVEISEGKWEAVEVEADGTAIADGAAWVDGEYLINVIGHPMRAGLVVLTYFQGEEWMAHGYPSRVWYWGTDDATCPLYTVGDALWLHTKVTTDGITWSASDIEVTDSGPCV